SVCADDAVTRHQHRNRIGGAGAGHGASAVRIAQRLGDVAIAACLAGRYLAQRSPDALLKRRRGDIGRHFAVRRLAFQLLGDCVRPWLQTVRVRFEAASRKFAPKRVQQFPIGSAEADGTNAAVSGGDQETSERAWHNGEAYHVIPPIKQLRSSFYALTEY